MTASLTHLLLESVPEKEYRNSTHLLFFLLSENPVPVGSTGRRWLVTPAASFWKVAAARFAESCRRSSEWRRTGTE
uniref:Uncharacterized protein n=1 Tax=Arundo donax TaxID=35708 RepID=A0A0A9H1C1_ARUDO